ncbi:calcineurin responsive transcriptional factor [Favolaschia claudopus]|uniref:Calcineurin responsive transcriptional factor n=1 Tax=Favolaschia claudopus TaxID=2862362 RepID=A0AAW0C3S4_9AGAR
MDPQHHDTAEYIADEGNDFRIQLDSADAAFNLGSPQFPHTPSYNGSYHNSPYSGHSELSFSGGDLGLFEEEAAVVPEYDPSEYDPPQSSSLLMFNDTDYSFSSVPVNVDRGTSYDYSSPSSTGSGEQRSRASSISQSGSPRMNVAQAFDNMTFRSPNWGTDPLPRDRPPSPHPKSPPRLMTAPIINAPEGDGLGPRLHIVPATPVSGGGAASAAVPFQTSLETLREPPQEQPLHFPRPRSSSDHDPPSWQDNNFIGQMGNIGSALDDEAPRQRPSFNSFHFGDNNGFLSPDLRRSRSASEHTRPGHTRQTRSEDMRSLLPVDFSGPQFLSPVDPPPPSIRARGHYRSHSSGSWSNASSTRPSPYPSPHASPVPLPDSRPSNSNLHNPTVSKQNVTTIRTQKASHNRRKQEATFVCPVPGCGSTFTRSFNLKGHIRSHNEERPFLCKWPGCGKGFARQHDCKRHEQLHTNYRPFVCEGVVYLLCCSRLNKIVVPKRKFLSTTALTSQLSSPRDQGRKRLASLELIGFSSCTDLSTAGAVWSLIVRGEIFDFWTFRMPFWRGFLGLG